MKGKDKKEKTNREKHSAKLTLLFIKKINQSNKLMNEESNRIITWSLSIIGGSVLIIISTSYIQPTGKILYSYFLFALGWLCLGTSIFFGEMLTRIYIAGITVADYDLDGIKKIGVEADKKFNSQIRWFRIGIITFSIWLITFLIWFILFKNTNTNAI